MSDTKEQEEKADREFLQCDADRWGWDGYHVEDAVGFARMYRRLWQEARKDALRLEHLIQQAYSGLNDDLTEPFAAGMVIGGRVAWPEGVRPAIDAAMSAQEKT